MAKKDSIIEIKKIVGTKKLVIGKSNTMKKLRQGKVKKIFLSSNLPQETKDSVSKYAEIKDVEVVEMDKDNEEMGVICKKPFGISMLSVVD